MLNGMGIAVSSRLAPAFTKRTSDMRNETTNFHRNGISGPSPPRIAFSFSFVGSQAHRRQANSQIEWPSLLLLLLRLLLLRVCVCLLSQTVCFREFINCEFLISQTFQSHAVCSFKQKFTRIVDRASNGWIPIVRVFFWFFDSTTKLFTYA